MDNRPIGVFDSGLGGLSCVKELKKMLPRESIEYFGDTGRVPYGTRSRETVVNYARQDEQFLLSRGVKMIIAACGTVSSVASSTANDLPVPFLGVVAPAASAAVKMTKTKRIGIIGTAATVASGSYVSAIHDIDDSIEVIAVNCSLLVPIVEAGYIKEDDELTLTAVRRLLAPIVEFGVDTLILGCTHFPLISGIIGRVMGENVTLISAGSAVADECVRVLRDNDMLCSNEHTPEYNFFVTDRPDGFSKTAELFFDGEFDGEVTRVDIG